MVFLLPDIQASRILLLAAALAILCSATNAQYTFSRGNAEEEPIWKCDKTKVLKITNKEARDQCLGFCDRVTKTVTDLEVEFFWSSGVVRVRARVLVVRVRARVLSSHPHALTHRNRTKNWEPAIKKSFVFKRQLLYGRCVAFQYFWESDCELLQHAARSTQHALCCSSHVAVCCISIQQSVAEHTSVLPMLLLQCLAAFCSAAAVAVS